MAWQPPSGSHSGTNQPQGWFDDNAGPDQQHPFNAPPLPSREANDEDASLMGEIEDLMYLDLLQDFGLPAAPEQVPPPVDYTVPQGWELGEASSSRAVYPGVANPDYTWVDHTTGNTQPTTFRADPRTAQDHTHLQNFSWNDEEVENTLRDLQLTPDAGGIPQYGFLPECFGPETGEPAAEEFSNLNDPTFGSTPAGDIGVNAHPGYNWSSQFPGSDGLGVGTTNFGQHQTMMFPDPMAAAPSEAASGFGEGMAGAILPPPKNQMNPSMAGSGFPGQNAQTVWQDDPNSFGPGSRKGKGKTRAVTKATPQKRTRARKLRSAADRPPEPKVLDPWSELGMRVYWQEVAELHRRIKAKDFRCPHPNCQKRVKQSEHGPDDPEVFSSGTKLWRHYIECHWAPLNPVYVCLMDGHRFQRKDSARRHVRNQHREVPNRDANVYICKLPASRHVPRLMEGDDGDGGGGGDGGEGDVGMSGLPLPVPPDPPPWASRFGGGPPAPPPGGGASSAGLVTS